MEEDEYKKLLAAALACIERVQPLIPRVGDERSRLGGTRPARRRPVTLYDADKTALRLKAIEDARRVRSEAMETRLALQHARALAKQAAEALKQSRS